MVHSFSEAFRHRGCPICHRLDADEYNFMCQFQSQIRNEEEIRQGLVSAGGYCNFHFYEMARLTSPGVNALVVKELIAKEIKEIQGRFLPPCGKVRCPVCQHQWIKEDGYLEELAELLRHPLIQSEYEQTDGLCCPHLQQELPRLRKDSCREFLLAAQFKQMQRLLDQLTSFLDQEELPSAMRKSLKNIWWVAIQKRAGKRGLPTPVTFS